MKPNVKIMGVQSYLFPMVGGPYHKLKFRICEPLPAKWEILGPQGELHTYMKTDLPERKRWPVMYVYQEASTSDDDHSTGDERTRRLGRIAKAILFDPRSWFHPDS